MKVYLSGGMHGDWQDYFINQYPDVEFFDPRSHDLTDPRDYTKWDLFHIRKCDAVIAYLEKDNPSGVGLAFEIGYALGIGKPVYFTNEKEDRYFAIVNYAVNQHSPMPNGAESIHFNSLEEMIAHFIARGGIPEERWYR